MEHGRGSPMGQNQQLHQPQHHHHHHHHGQPHPHFDDSLLLPPPPPPPHEVRRTRSSSALSSPNVVAPPPPSRFKTALGEAQFLASGLVSRPAESTKHYTIIRHSNGLVWYKGPKTSVSITILADEPVPTDRTIFLQQKGYSGNMGMSLKALIGPRDNWIDVTPHERAMQRDMTRFASKASGRLKKHIPRETHLLRIPASASDGYFRLVLCTGDGDGDDTRRKKMLCSSPVFRLASTSADVSIVRGASLSTMPLEMGIKAASTAGAQVVKKYTGVAGAMVMHGWQQHKRRQHRQQHNGPLLPDGAASMPSPDVQPIGTDDGPEKPFPIQFDGRVCRGTGRSTAESSFPTAKLDDVPDDITARMSGVFAAWAIMTPAKAVLAGPDVLPSEWLPAVVTMAPARDVHPTVAIPNAVHVRIAAELDTPPIFLDDARVKVVLMAHLHAAPAATATTDALRAQHARDVSVTLNSLGREAWCPHRAMARIQAPVSTRSVGERLDHATGRVQRTVDRIPLHWAGVRSESAAGRDMLIGRGGMWVRRC
ncbi:hypothetical protein E4U41_004062 [Claviceps citrina]|nr:hypothetical protein E4U41_004062 [Claviceps citrina]